MQTQKFESEILESIGTSRVRILKLTCPKLDFLPGQFVMVSVEGFEDEKGPVTRPYSVSSAVSADHIELCISRSKYGKLSNKLCDLKVGDKVNMAGPYGIFNLRELAKSNAIFVAGGAGIAPIMGLLRTLYTENFSEPLRLFYGIRNPSEYLYREELELFAKEKGLKLVVAVSDDFSDWNGDRGFISDVLQKYLKKEDVPCYICGPSVMVVATAEKLKNLGFENISKEEWG